MKNNILKTFMPSQKFSINVSNNIFKKVSSKTNKSKTIVIKPNFHPYRKKMSILLMAVMAVTVTLPPTDTSSATNPKSDQSNWTTAGMLQDYSDKLPWKELPASKASSIGTARNAIYTNSRKYNQVVISPRQFQMQQSPKRAFCIDRSSAISSNHEAANAIDGLENTSWTSAWDSKDHWLHINFYRKRLFSSLYIQFGPFRNEATVKKFYIQFYFKGSWFNFQEVIIKNKNPYHAEKIFLGGVDASQFRIFIPKDGSYRGIVVIREIKIFLGNRPIVLMDNRLTDFNMPIKNSFLPENRYLYPNAPRKYRNGVHAGLDFTEYLAKSKGQFIKKPLHKKIAIHAVKEGTVIRSDFNYRPFDRGEYKRASQYWKQRRRTFVMRSFGGRQVWIDHGEGIVSCYNHLDKILPEIKTGKKVERDQILGYAGNSGLSGESQGNNKGIHLHFELWVDGEFLGRGLPHDQVRWLYQRLFQRSMQ